MSFKLSIEQGKGRGQAFDFDAETITIGRAEENDIVLYDEQGVSRRHARIARVGDKYVIEDLESANGTLLNGVRVNREPLADGDTVGVGSVLFRFGLGTAQPQSENSSTRIVSLTKDVAPKAAPKAAPARIQNGPEAPKDGAGGTIRLRIAMYAIAGAFALAILLTWVLNRSAGSITQKPACESVIPYEDVVRLFAFGNNAEAQCASTNKVTFSFSLPKGPMRVVLSYAPFYVDSDKVQVLLNNTQIEDVPLAPTRESRRHEITLPTAGLKEGQENLLSFVAIKGGEWGIDRMELQFFSPQDMNPAAAEAAYARGQRLFQQRHVAAPNLYKAWIELRKARRAMEWMTNKPAIYRPTLELIATAEHELDVACREQLFSAERDTRYDHFDDANERYQYIFAAFPGDVHPCRFKAQQKVAQLAQLQQQASGH